MHETLHRMWTQPHTIPSSYEDIVSATKASNFAMASDALTCTLLSSLAACKSQGKFLELGTGTGLSTSWLLHGMDPQSSLVSIDNDEACIAIAERYLGEDKRVEFIVGDGHQWILRNAERKFDFIFADTWPGKYFLLEETLRMLNDGGMYIIDDMLPQDNWPEGHEAKAIDLIRQLEARQDLSIAKLQWATGIVIATKRSVN